MDASIRAAVALFGEVFSSEPTTAAAAPGRVNLIGEHTDYNEGFVLPMALDKATVVVGRRTQSDVVRVFSKAMDDLLQFPSPSPSHPLPAHPTEEQWDQLCIPKHWGNYVKGVIAQFHDLWEGQGCVPFDAVVLSSVPLGGGLSSSASLEVALWTFLDALRGGPPTDDVTKSLRCQAAEHRYARVPCGIMDQFVCSLAQKDHSLLIDCRSPYPVEQVPLRDPDVVVLIANSNVRHQLAGGEYEARRRDCEAVARVLGQPSLREATMADLKAHEAHLSAVQLQRARHVVREIARTREAVEALRNGDYQHFGRLMVDSHASLRDDYEVSCPELDQLVTIATNCRGVFGSRMTGGGFGGCTVTMVTKDAVQECISTIQKQYKGTATCFVCTASAGARPVDLADL